MTAAGAALALLAELDARLEGHAGPPRTLAPDRARATPVEELGASLLADQPTAIAVAFAHALARLADAQLTHFPHNLYWDFDYTAASLLRTALQHPDPVEQLGVQAEQLARLHARFGCHSAIRFRYVHDFSYGLDWERWARRDPARVDFGPLSARFVARMLDRGQALLERIELGDETFPVLAPGDFRNPFPFSRAPEHEMRLHEALARDGLLPVAAWRVDAVPDFSKPYSRLRLERAKALCLPQNH